MEKILEKTKEGKMLKVRIWIEKTLPWSFMPLIILPVCIAYLIAHDATEGARYLVILFLVSGLIWFGFAKLTEKQWDEYKEKQKKVKNEKDF